MATLEVLFGLILIGVILIWRHIKAAEREAELMRKRCPTCRGLGRKEVSPGSGIPGPEDCLSCLGTGMRRAA